MYRVSPEDEQAAREAFSLADNQGDFDAMCSLFAKHRFNHSAIEKYALGDLEPGHYRDFPRSGERYRNGACKTSQRIYASAKRMSVRYGWEFRIENLDAHTVRATRVR